MISGINRWDGSQVINREKPYICGDTISDLRTNQNKLSVWKADSQEEIDDAVVALALGAKNGVHCYSGTDLTVTVLNRRHGA